MREHLYRALTTPCGLILDTDEGDVPRLIQKLHAERRAAQDPALAALTILPSRTDPEHQVWIAHQPKVEAALAEEA